MKFFRVAGWLFFSLLQVVLAVGQSKIDLTLDLIEMNVPLGAELRAKLTEACANPDVLKDDIIFPAMEKYLEDKDDEEFQKLRRWGWYISAELIRTLAANNRPDRNFRVIDELKLHFDSVTDDSNRRLYYICYELLAKIILLRGLKKDLVKISFDKLMKSDYIGMQARSSFLEISEEIYAFLFKRESKRKVPNDQQPEKRKKKRKARFETIEIEVDASASDSESSSLSAAKRRSGEFIAIYRDSDSYHDSDADSENASKNEPDCGNYNQNENFHDSSESSSEESQDAEIELNFNEATEILKNPLKAFKTRTHREFKKACDVYLSSAFHEADKSVLEDVKKVILSSTRDKFEK